MIPQEQLRIVSLELAIKYLAEHLEDNTNPVALAQQFFEYINGETK